MLDSLTPERVSRLPADPTNPENDAWLAGTKSMTFKFIKPLGEGSIEFFENGPSSLENFEGTTVTLKLRNSQETPSEDATEQVNVFM